MTRMREESGETADQDTGVSSGPGIPDPISHSRTELRRPRSPPSVHRPRKEPNGTCSVVVSDFWIVSSTARPDTSRSWSPVGPTGVAR